VGYKRKARVVFLSSGDGCRAMLAAVFANTTGAEFIEARAMVLHPVPPAPALVSALRETGVTLAEHMPTPFDAGTLAWADLVVTLDEAADRACPAVHEWTQKRCYPFAHPTDLDSLRQVRDAIKRRVEGMVSGMAMIT